MALLQAFLAPDADLNALSTALRPAAADYEAVFTPVFAAKAKAAHAEPWDEGKFVEPGQTLGMAFDGRVHVNGHWIIFPKSWKVLE